MSGTTVEISVDGRILVGVPRAEYRRLTEGASATTERLRGQLESAQKAHAGAISAREELRRSLDDALEEIKRLSDERDEWRRRAEDGLSPSARSSLGPLMSAFGDELAKFSNRSNPHHGDARRSIEALKDAAVAAVYAENESGGRARSVVAEIATALGADIDEGDGHRWDLDHMARVIERAKWVAESRDFWEAEERRTRVQADALLSEASSVSDVDELRATIVRQATEITRLTGESE